MAHFSIKLKYCSLQSAFFNNSVVVIKKIISGNEKKKAGFGSCLDFRLDQDLYEKEYGSESLEAAGHCVTL